MSYKTYIKENTRVTCFLPLTMDFLTLVGEQLSCPNLLMADEVLEQSDSRYSLRQYLNEYNILKLSFCLNDIAVTQYINV